MLCRRWKGHFSSATPFHPIADRRGPPERHPADGQVGSGKPAGGTLALQGATRDTEGAGQLVKSKGQSADFAGGIPGQIGLGVTALAFSLGPIAFQANTKVATDMNLAPDFVRTILFGNVDSVGAAGSPNGKVKKRDFTGTSFRGAAYSTAAVSFGTSMLKMLPLSNFAAGATVKYTVGHALGMAVDRGSAIDSSAINLDVPMIVTSPDSAKRSRVKFC